MNEAEKKSYSVVTCNGSKEIIVKEKPADKLTKTFTFDKVFGPDSKQVNIVVRHFYHNRSNCR